MFRNIDLWSDAIDLSVLLTQQDRGREIRKKNRSLILNLELLTRIAYVKDFALGWICR